MRNIGGVALLVAAMVGAGAAPALAADGLQDTATILAQYNQARATAGLPPVTADPRMTEGCANHLKYQAIHGATAEFHDETPGREGYTVLGQRAAQRSEGGSTFAGSPPLRPTSTAPAHRAGYLDPIPTKVGIAENHVGASASSCLWTSVYEDADLKPARRVVPDPKAWAITTRGGTNTWNFEVAFEGPTVPAFDVGYIAERAGRYVAGEHILLYHDDLPEGALYAACRAVLLGPGGRPVDARLLRGRLLVPRDPFLPGGQYRAIGTHSTAEVCGPLQRTGGAAFTTEDRVPDAELLTIGEPSSASGKWRATTTIDPLLHGLSKGRFRAEYPSGYVVEQPCFCPADDFTGEPAGDLTFRVAYEGFQIGPMCYSGGTVARTFTVTKAGDNASATTNVTAGPMQVTRPDPDPCTRPPSAGPPSPAAGAPGTVVRIAGDGVAKAVAVTFGGVAATAWGVDGDALDVTVPAGAKSGAVAVRTSTGTSTATMSFTVPAADTAAPDTRIDLGPSGAGESSTAQFAFTSTEGAASFRCQADGSPSQPCMSPLSLEGLAEGAHQVAITAVDAAGNADATPAVAAWRVGPGAVPVPAVPTTPNTPVEPITPAKVATPKLAVSTARVRLGAGTLTLGKLTVPARSRVRVAVSARLRGRRLAITSTTRVVAAGRTVTLSSRLSKAVRQRLRGVRRLPLTATITVRPTSGAKPTTIRRTLSVKVS
ncbi:hypothetical protein DSM112329_03752 [Paraconexibacter sp. AEG42_29]|uniref:SCP domain-containing protein n=1 Tax=Paraconexibacter sp. AEG42_29 TaxID=2997339 RepID=A0AAU7AZX7_9ACTN